MLQRGAFLPTHGQKTATIYFQLWRSLPATFCSFQSAHFSLCYILKYSGRAGSSGVSLRLQSAPWERFVAAWLPGARWPPSRAVRCAHASQGSRQKSRSLSFRFFPPVYTPLLFFLPDCPARSSSSVWDAGLRGHLALDLRERQSNFTAVQSPPRVFTNAFIRAKLFPSNPNLPSIVSHEKVPNFVKCLFCVC